MNELAEKMQELIKDFQDAEAQAVVEGKHVEQAVLKIVTTQFAVIANELRNLANGI